MTNNNNKDDHGTLRTYDGVYGYGATDGVIYDSQPKPKKETVVQEKKPWWSTFTQETNIDKKIKDRAIGLDHMREQTKPTKKDERKFLKLISNGRIMDK